MYSWEIANYIKEHGYTITREEYFNIIRSSPQISNVKYIGGYTFALTAEDIHIKFNVKAS